jgi:hypothetical protein
MPVPACGNGRARAEHPRARRSPLEVGVYPRARRSPLEVSVHPRTGRSPLEGGVRPRARRSLLEGTFAWAVAAAWAVPRVCALSKMCLALVFACFKRDFPSCFRGPSGLSPTKCFSKSHIGSTKRSPALTHLLSHSPQPTTAFAKATSQPNTPLDSLPFAHYHSTTGCGPTTACTQSAHARCSGRNFTQTITRELALVTDLAAAAGGGGLSQVAANLQGASVEPSHLATSNPSPPLSVSTEYPCVLRHAGYYWD